MLLVIVKNAEGKVCAQVPFNGGSLTIGRDKTRHVVLESRSVSRHHGSLLASGGKVLYVDEGSSNGSRVDGQAVTTPVPLTGRSVIEIGDYLITLQLARPTGVQDSKHPTVPASSAATTESSGSAESVVRAAATQAAASEPDLDVQPVMVTRPPTRPAPPPTGLEGFRITLGEAPKPEQKKQEAGGLADKVSGLLEQQIQGIRSQRQDHQETTRTRRESFEQAWREAIVGARELKNRVGNDPRVLFYVISRDEQEVTVKLKENSERGFCNVTISRRHPIKETMAEGILWFAETGSEPRSYSNPKEMLEDFVRAIAVKLA